MNEQRKKLLKLILIDYSDELGNNVCNDLSREWEDAMSKEEWKKMIDEFNIWNKSKDPDQNVDYLVDSAVVHFLAEHLD